MAAKGFGGRSMNSPEYAWVLSVLLDFERLLLRVHPQVTSVSVDYVTKVLARFGGCPRFLHPLYLSDRRSYPSLLRVVLHALRKVSGAMLFRSCACSDSTAIILPKSVMLLSHKPEFSSFLIGGERADVVYLPECVALPLIRMGRHHVGQLF